MNRPLFKSEKGVTVIGHRGARSLAPENTLAGLRAGVALKLPWIEFDVEISKDDVAVVVHQETMALAASGTAVELASEQATRGWTYQLPFSTLAKVDAGSWYDAKFSGERIPSLKEALSLSWDNSGALIEIKDAFQWDSLQSCETQPRAKRLVASVAREVDQFQKRGQRVALLSFSSAVLDEAKQVLPSVPTVLCVWSDRRAQVHDTISLAKQIGAAALSIADFLLLENPEWIKEAHARGLSCIEYDYAPAHEAARGGGVNEERKNIWLRLATHSIDGVTVDAPEVALATLEDAL